MTSETLIDTRIIFASADLKKSDLYKKHLSTFPAYMTINDLVNRLATHGLTINRDAVLTIYRMIALSPLPVTVTSWLRLPDAHTRIQNSVKNSKHQMASAVDIQFHLELLLPSGKGKRINITKLMIHRLLDSKIFPKMRVGLPLYQPDSDKFFIHIEVTGEKTSPNELFFERTKHATISIDDLIDHLDGLPSQAVIADGSLIFKRIDNIGPTFVTNKSSSHNIVSKVDLTNKISHEFSELDSSFELSSLSSIENPDKIVHITDNQTGNAQLLFVALSLVVKKTLGSVMDLVFLEGDNSVWSNVKLADLLTGSDEFKRKGVQINRDIITKIRTNYPDFFPRGTDMTVGQFVKMADTLLKISSSHSVDSPAGNLITKMSNQFLIKENEIN